MKKSKVRRLSIRVKILLPASLLIILLCVVMGLNSYLRTKSNLIEMGVEEARMAAVVAAKNINGDQLAELTAEDVGGSSYQELLSSMEDIKAACGIRYLYTLYTDGSQVYYGIDTDSSENHADFGKPFEVPYEDLKGVFGGEMYLEDFIDSTENGDLISAYMPVTDSSGQNVVAIVGCDYDASGVTSRLYTTLSQVIQISVICLLLALIIINVIVSAIIRSMYVVDRKISELVHHGGDLTRTLEVHSGDEMELIAGHINELLQYIRTIMIVISQNSTYLNQSSRTVAGNLSNANVSISEISATMEEMSAAMEESSASMDQINESIQNTFSSIAELYRQAEKGSGSSKQIKQNASEIYRKAVEQQECTRLQVARMADSLQQKITKSKEVERVRELTKNIITITQQTNLLALNASIEAARAGESGKGFAVVADEIGKLASNSANSAAQIQNVTLEVIQAVDELATEAEEMINLMHTTAMGGYEELLTTGKTYQNDAENIDEMLQKFTAENEQLKENVNCIREALEGMKTAVSESALGISNVAEMAVNLTNNMHVIDEKAKKNLDISEQLDQEVHKFKL